MPGVRVRVSEKCTGCGRCVKSNVCYVNALSLEERRAKINEEWCKGCGRCVEICQNKAIELEISDMDFITHSVQRLAPLVDIKAE